MIICLIGNMGGGKTLSMTNELYKSYNKKKSVFCNYKLNFKYNVLSMDLLKKYYENSKQLQNTSIGIDEAHIFLDSRNFMSTNNKLLSYFLLQTRKRGINCYLTFQKFSQIDKRIRENATYLIICDSYEKIGGKLFKLFDGEFIISSGNVWIKQDWFITDKLEDWKYFKTIYIQGKELYSKYNTNEIINFNEV